MSQWPKARPPKEPALKKTRAPRPVRTHVFLNGGQVNHAGEPICARDDCGNLRNHAVHQLEETPEHVVKDQARLLGEGGEAA